MSEQVILRAGKAVHQVTLAGGDFLRVDLERGTVRVVYYRHRRYGEPGYDSRRDDWDKITCRPPDQDSKAWDRLLRFPAKGKTLEDALQLALAEGECMWDVPEIASFIRQFEWGKELP